MKKQQRKVVRSLITTIIILLVVNHFIPFKEMKMGESIGVMNPGFESGNFSQWEVQKESKSYAFVETGYHCTNPHSGNYVARLFTYRGGATISQTIPRNVKVGEKYQFDVWLKSTMMGQTGVWITPTLKLGDDFKETTWGYTPNWQRVSIIKVAENDASSITVSVRLHSPDDYMLFVDDIDVRKIGEVTTTTTSTTINGQTTTTTYPTTTTTLGECTEDETPIAGQCVKTEQLMIIGLLSLFVIGGWYYYKKS